MKRLAIVFAVLFVFSISAEAQMGGEGKMPMCPMCEQMMKQMMGDGMMMSMMQMMMDMMKMQQKMIKGIKPDEKKAMMMEMDKMMEKMNKMMSMHMGMMMGMGNSQGRLKCAEEWLKKAIDLHELHMKDPKTTTEASQMELMNQMKKAYECIKGGPQSKEQRGKETEKAEPKKQHEHRH